MNRILLVEDDTTINHNIKDALTAEGFIVDAVFDGLLAERFLKKETYGCIILDINLPGRNGYDLCRDIRKTDTHTPVIMLTAFDELEDKVQGYESGADDYLTKPFYMQELVLKINLLIKRSSALSDPGHNHKVVAGDLIIDQKGKRVFFQQTEIILTPREYNVLLKLVLARGEVVSKKELVREIWGTTLDVNTNTIEVYINFLRKKLDKTCGRNAIKTKVGYGYYFSEK